MKKKFICLLPLLAILTSCYWDTEVPVADKTVLTISSEGKSIEINDESFLDVKEASGVVKNIKWACSDDSIVKITKTSVEIVEDEESQYNVSRATFKALHAGTATISAYLKTKVVSCAIVVTDSLEAPVLHISTTKCNLYAGDTYNFSSYVTYHDTYFYEDENNNPFVYSYVSDDDPNNIVYFEDTNTGFALTGLANGEVNYTVSTSLFGLSCSAKINICVKNNKDFIDIENATPISGGFSIDLTTINDGVNIDSIVPVCKVYNTDGSPKQQSITLTSSDPSVVEVIGTKLQAHKVGNVIVDVVSSSASVTIKVNVIKPTYFAHLTNDVIDISDAKSTHIKTLNFADATIHGDGISLSVNDSDNVLKNISGQDINLDYNSLICLNVSQLGEQRKFVLETSKAFYEFYSDIYSMIINTPEELNSWQDEADKYKELSYASSGYFILGNSISMNGTLSPVHWNRSIKEITDGTNANHGFHGIFDGCGYTIDGYHPTGYGSFITLLASDGVIKNVGFKNIVVKGDETGDSKERCILLCAGSGKVSNVYLGYKEVNFSAAPAMERCSMFSGLGPVNAGKGQIEKVFVEGPTYNSSSFKGFFDLMGKCDYAEGFYGLGGIHLGRYPLKRDPSDTYSIEYPYQYWGTGSYFGYYQEYDNDDVLKTTIKTKQDLINDSQTIKAIKESFGYATWEYSLGYPQWIVK